MAIVNPAHILEPLKNISKYHPQHIEKQEMSRNNI